MFVYVMKSAVVFLTAICTAVGGGILSSDCEVANLSRFCPASHGQKAAHDCFDTLFTAPEKPSPTTEYSAFTSSMISVPPCFNSVIKDYLTTEFGGKHE